MRHSTATLITEFRRADDPGFIDDPEFIAQARIARARRIRADREYHGRTYALETAIRFVGRAAVAFARNHPEGFVL